MPHYMLAAHTRADEDQDSMTAEEQRASWERIQTIETEMKSKGAWVFSARLHDPDTAYNLFATIAIRPGMATISVLGAWAMILVAILLIGAAILIAYDAWGAWTRLRGAPVQEPAPATTG
jgi:hypothetical protein